MAVQDTLDEREKVYGDFAVLAGAIQAFRNVYRSAPGWKKMTAVQREVMDMDIVKNCRLLYGDPTAQLDSWHDKSGYAMLATEEFAKTHAQKTEMAPPAEPTHPMDLDADPAPLFLGQRAK